jgi:hypothetical protein
MKSLVECIKSISETNNPLFITDLIDDDNEKVEFGSGVDSDELIR